MRAREHAFTDIDAQPDPGAWIDVLDRLGRDPLYAGCKRRTMALLDPEPGGRYLEVRTGTGADAHTASFASGPTARFATAGWHTRWGGCSRRPD